jgi:hypothetical protein
MKEKDFVYLRNLYPIGLSQDPDIRISAAARQRFERWPTSAKFVCENEEGAMKSFPLAFLKRGEDRTFKVPYLRDGRNICLSSCRRFYLLADGRLVVKVVTWIAPGNPNLEMGGQYPERIYYFAEPSQFPFLRRKTPKAA